MDKAYYKTLQPLIDSGHLQAAINGIYKFPDGVNLFPGISCMFDCAFCGRDRDTKLPNYNYFYDTLLDQDPKDNLKRYNISGGLEPLTYNEIDRLAKDLVDRGFKEFTKETKPIKITPYTSIALWLFKTTNPIDN